MIPGNYCEFATIFYFKEKMPPLSDVTSLSAQTKCTYIHSNVKVAVLHALLPWRSVLAVFAELTPKSGEEREWTIAQWG